MYDIEEQKKLAAYRAVHEVQDGMVLGLGTGSTVYYLILELAERVRHGLDIHAAATSLRSEELSASHGIPLIPVNDAPVIHLAIDGVDAIDPEFYSIKGGGGALFREKVIAKKARRVIWIMDQSKLVPSLDASILPVEVLPFALAYVEEQVRGLGLRPVLRKKDGAAYITDNGNYILDLGWDETRPGSESQMPNRPGMDYRLIAGKIKGITGVLETGLFDCLCEKIIVGTEHGPIERYNHTV